jgi:hypothetical protein
VTALLAAGRNSGLNGTALSECCNWIINIL